MEIDISGITKETSGSAKFYITAVDGNLATKVEAFLEQKLGLKKAKVEELKLTVVAVLPVDVCEKGAGPLMEHFNKKLRELS